MDRMTLDPQADSVISFGEPARRTLLRDLGRDRRLPVLTAGLGGVAAFGSLISEWQTTTMNGLVLGGEPGVGARVEPTGLLDTGAVGAGYLGGLLLLATAIVLVLFGPAAGRRHAQLAGYAVGGVLIALLLALVHHLGTTSLLIPRYFMLGLTDEKLQMDLGRGLWCALAAVGAGLLALRLSSSTEAIEVAEATEDSGRHPAAPEPERFDDPLDLTISPTTPFASFPGELDQPHRS